MIIGLSTYYSQANDTLRMTENNAQLMNTICTMVWFKMSCWTLVCCIPCILLIVMGTAGLTMAGAALGGVVAV